MSILSWHLVQAPLLATNASTSQQHARESDIAVAKAKRAASCEAEHHKSPSDSHKWLSFAGMGPGVCLV